MRKILYNGQIYTTPGLNDWIKEGYVIIEGHEIVEIGTGVPQFFPEDERYDLRGSFVLPGLINTHGHTPMSLLRGYADDLPLQQWLTEKMWPLEAKYKPDQTRAATLLSQVEMIRSGTTAFTDMYDHMDQVAETVEISGLRAVLSRGVIGLCSREEQIEKFNDALSFTRRWHNQADGRITTMVSPHSAYTCPKSYLLEFIELARELQLPIHTHLSETKWEVQETVNEHGVRPVIYLDQLGLFDGPTLVAHAVHLDEDELRILAEKDVRVSHNPISNLKLGSGIASVPRMMELGIKVSLGTDSSASNNNLDLFDELRMTALLHKGVTGDPTVISAPQSLYFATIGGAEALYLDHIVGSIEKGKRADLIVIDVDQAHYYPQHNLISHLVYAGKGSDVKDMMIDGKWIMRNQEIKTVDEEKIRYEAQNATHNLLL